MRQSRKKTHNNYISIMTLFSVRVIGVGIIWGIVWVGIIWGVVGVGIIWSVKVCIITAAAINFAILYS